MHACSGNLCTKFHTLSFINNWKNRAFYLQAFQVLLWNCLYSQDAPVKFYLSVTFGLSCMISPVAPTRLSTFYAYLIIKIKNRNLNPITYRACGGLFGPNHLIIDHNPKTALSSTSKLGDFLVLSIGHILAQF